MLNVSVPHKFQFVLSIFIIFYIIDRAKREILRLDFWLYGIWHGPKCVFPVWLVELVRLLFILFVRFASLLCVLCMIENCKKKEVNGKGQNGMGTDVCSTETQRVENKRLNEEPA